VPGERARSVGFWVALASRFRQESDDVGVKIHQPADLGQGWKTTLDSVAVDGLLKQILYVDQCKPLSGASRSLPKTRS
jgi:hypothetical protein